MLSDVRSTHYEDQKIRVLSCEGKLLFLIMSVALVSGATKNTQTENMVFKLWNVFRIKSLR